MCLLEWLFEVDTILILWIVWAVGQLMIDYFWPMFAAYCDQLALRIGYQLIPGHGVHCTGFFRMRDIILSDDVSRMTEGGRMTMPELSALVELEKIRWTRRRNFRIWIFEQVGDVKRTIVKVALMTLLKIRMQYCCFNTHV